VVRERRAGIEAGRRSEAAVVKALGHELRLVQELVALEHPNRVPRRRRDPERHPDAGLAGIVAGGPLLQVRQDPFTEQRGWPGPVVLPREELVVVDPRCAGRRLLLAHEREIRDRQQPLPLPAPPVAIAERIELLDVADLEPGLVTHPAPQAPLERRVAEWIERTGWNREACAAGADREQLRPIVGDGDD